jgi:hypothetical protein
MGESKKNDICWTDNILTLLKALKETEDINWLIKLLIWERNWKFIYGVLKYNWKYNWKFNQ